MNRRRFLTIFPALFPAAKALASVEPTAVAPAAVSKPFDWYRDDLKLHEDFKGTIICSGWVGPKLFPGTDDL